MLEFLQLTRNRRAFASLREQAVVPARAEFESAEISASPRLEEMLASINDVFDSLVRMDAKPENTK